jgi:hypothetical protein
VGERPPSAMIGRRLGLAAVLAPRTPAGGRGSQEGSAKERLFCGGCGAAKGDPGGALAAVLRRQLQDRVADDLTVRHPLLARKVAARRKGRRG